MTTIQIGATRPPQNSPAYKELTRSSGYGSRRVSRWTGRPCQLVPEGRVFFQLGSGDRERYTQAGCTYMGAQPVRHSLMVGGSQGMSIGSTWTDAWCCQQPQVVQVFEQYVASPEYRRNKMIGLAFAGAMIFGVAYLFLNRKKFGAKMGAKDRQEISWAANPDDTHIFRDDFEYDKE